MTCWKRQNYRNNKKIRSEVARGLEAGGSRREDGSSKEQEKTGDLGGSETILYETIMVDT